MEPMPFFRLDFILQISANQLTCQEKHVKD